MNEYEHVIRIEYEGDRGYWECDCGAAGSAPEEHVDIAAERHIPADASAVYRYPAE